MHRFYLPRPAWDVRPLELTGDEASHALQVLRLEKGDKIVLFDGEGTEATASILETRKHSLTADALFQSKTPRLPCEITLAQAVPKGKNMDLIVQKAVELGAARIAPLLSDRTVVHLDPSDAPRKQEKWQDVAVEACKQCGQNWLPEVLPPVTPTQFFSEPSGANLLLIASLQADAVHLKTVLSEYAATSGTPRPRAVTVLVGPEGDFTPAEIALAKSHGCRPITLGPIILRTETAAIYCLSILSHELLNATN